MKIVLKIEADSDKSTKMKKVLKKIILIIAMFSPNFLKLLFYRQLGCIIANNVRIGFSYIDCQKMILEEDTRIGNFNVIRRLKSFEMRKKSYIKNFNQFFFSGDLSSSPEWAGKIVIGENVHIMSHHFIDAGGSICIGENTTIAGRDTHIWSHTFIPIQENLEHSRIELNIGSNVYIGARSSVFNNVPDNAIVGLGSIVNKFFPNENNDVRLLIAGNPAVIKKRYKLKSKIDHKNL